MSTLKESFNAATSSIDNAFNHSFGAPWFSYFQGESDKIKEQSDSEMSPWDKLRDNLGFAFGAVGAWGQDVLSRFTKGFQSDEPSAAHSYESSGIASPASSDKNEIHENQDQGEQIDAVSLSDLSPEAQAVIAPGFSFAEQYGLNKVAGDMEDARIKAAEALANGIKQPDSSDKQFV